MTRTLMKTTRPGQLLARILGEPELVAAVRNLDARVLSRVINHLGLEDAGELVALATTDQLRTIFDEDLWHSERPGQDEAFDAPRFALWLEILLEAGDHFAARKLAELDEDLVTLALCRHLLVVDIDELALTMSESERSPEDDLTDKALESCLYHELEEYRLISRSHEAWDSILAVLVALDQEDHAHLRRLLERCCHASTEFIEDNGGLVDVLTSAEMLESDAAAEREDRRAAEGFVAPSAAASFLALARVTELQEIVDSPERDPITQAYFRSYASPRPGPAKSRSAPPAPKAEESAARVAELVDVLKQAEVLTDLHPPLLPQGSAAGTPAPDAPFRRAILDLHQRDPELYAQRMEELSYLGNVLVAGCSLGGRSFRPFEAAEAVVAVCNLGLEQLLQGAPGGKGRSAPARRASGMLAGQRADKLFRVGWNLLHHQVSRVAGRALVERLQALEEGEVTAQVRRAKMAVEAAVKADKPWAAWGKLDALEAVFAPSAVAAWKALLDECPTLAAKVAERVDESARHPDRAVEFIATGAQVKRAQALVRELLSGPSV